MDDTEKFLSDNDPLYKKKNRKSLLEYSYHSETQTVYRDCKEIPESALSLKQRNKLKCYNLDKALYKEDHN